MRRRLKRLLIGVLLLAGLYLLAVHLFLNSPLGTRAFNRRPERFRIDWTFAWSILPGRVEVRGLQVFGHTRNVSWSVSADRAGGWIDLPALFGKTFRVSSLHGDGVRSQVLRGRGAGSPLLGVRRARRGRTPWTLRFERITLDHVREIRFNDFRLTGDGEAAGAFRTVLGGEFQLDRSTLRMPAGQLAMGRETLARDIDLEAKATMGPYVVRRHQGLASFDFLSGSLQARGAVLELPFLDRMQKPQQKPGRLAMDLRVERGRLVPGSRFDVTAPSTGGASPFTMTAGVAAGPARPVLRLDVDAKGFSVGRRRRAPPVFRARTLSVSSTTPETRLSRIFATARGLRKGTPSDALSLVGDVQAEGVEIAAPGSRASLRATLDRAAGRIDLTGLLARRFVVNGLQADGVSARLDLAQSVSSPAPTGPAWSAHVTGARISGIREIGIGEALLSGGGQAEASFSYGRDGTFAMERGAINLRDGRFHVNGQPAAQDLALEVEARIGPAVLGKTRGPAFLRYVDGRGRLRGRISSLGFLTPYLEKTPWLALQGQGWLNADVRLDRGRVVPGSRLTVTASPVKATIFDSFASGSGTVSIAVEPGKTGPRTSLRVGFERFGLADLRQKGRPAYIRGRGLRIAAFTPAGLDLTSPIPDFDATIDLPDAEVPDLAAYNALIPEETGLSFISGSGRARMHLETSTATRKARGTATLISEKAKVQFQNLELEGAMKVQAPLVSPDLASRRFDLKGMRLELDGVSYHDIAAESPAEPSPWWMRAVLDSGSVVWGAPLSLRGAGRIDMRNSGPLLTLFVQRSRFLRWFDDALNVENVTAWGVLRLGNGAVEIESLRATGGPLEVQSRMIFAKSRGTGDLYIRYGRLAAGIELRDGQRTFKLRRPLEWFESRRGVATSP